LILQARIEADNRDMLGIFSAITNYIELCFNMKHVRQILGCRTPDEVKGE
jgi:hypothetical protein